MTSINKNKYLKFLKNVPNLAILLILAALFHTGTSTSGAPINPTGSESGFNADITGNSLNHHVSSGITSEIQEHQPGTGSDFNADISGNTLDDLAELLQNDTLISFAEDKSPALSNWYSREIYRLRREIDSLLQKLSESHVTMSNLREDIEEKETEVENAKVNQNCGPGNIGRYVGTQCLSYRSRAQILDDANTECSDEGGHLFRPNYDDPDYATKLNDAFSLSSIAVYTDICANGDGDWEYLSTGLLAYHPSFVGIDGSRRARAVGNNALMFVSNPPFTRHGSASVASTETHNYICEY